VIKVKIFKDKKNGFIERYNISGHAGYDVKGQDIVCAAVSALAQTVLISLVEVCGINEEKIDYLIDEGKGLLSVKVPKTIDIDTRNRAEIVLRVLEVGIKSIIENYPEYVTLEYGEV
jgi:hypothetical protein